MMIRNDKESDCHFWIIATLKMLYKTVETEK